MGGLTIGLSTPDLLFTYPLVLIYFLLFLFCCFSFSFSFFFSLLFSSLHFGLSRPKGPKPITEAEGGEGGIHLWMGRTQKS